MIPVIKNGIHNMTLKCNVIKIERCVTKVASALSGVFSLL
jgi:hypothetical protein